MKRIFIAIELPDVIKKKISELQGLIQGPYKWLAPEQIHLTILFLGETPPEKIHAVIKKLKEIRLGKFFLQLSELGFFTRKGVAFVLWAGLVSQSMLLQLEKQIRDKVIGLGIELEPGKEYFPHITFGRSKNAPPGLARKICAQYGNFFSGTGQGLKFAVEHFALFSSELRPEGAIYHREALFALH